MTSILQNDELLDLVDEQDRVIGSWTRSAIYREGMNNFRAVNAFLVNDAGQLWIPRRTATKRIFPLCLDMSVAGHVASGEDYLTAFRRELHEELNLVLDEVDWKFIGGLTPHQHGTSAFMHVYKIHSNEVPDYNPDDFVEYYWLYPHEVIDRLNSGDKSKDDLPKLVKWMYPRQE
ncbi:MAG: NUDIX domain-containing protein [Desulfuromonadaceae bacterium]|nr:NUDIX domain-containing protein [Desulfuromonadaceae bacterium]